MTYPQFYRFLGHCLKRESDTRTIEIRIPDPKQSLPLCHEPIAYKSKADLDLVVERMEEVDQDIYESFLSAFFQMAAENARKFSDYKQKKYESRLSQIGAAIAAPGTPTVKQVYGK